VSLEASRGGHAAGPGAEVVSAHRFDALRDLREAGGILHTFSPTERDRYRTQAAESSV